MTDIITPPALEPWERLRYDRALEFAVQAHGAQRRRYVDEPYWYHVARVATTISQTTGRSIEMIEAALLHDVLEDTSVTEYTIKEHFGGLVHYYVLMLTDPGPVFGNRAARKAYVLNRFVDCPGEVHSIKLADLIDNAPSIFKHDPNFSRVFYREKTELMKVLTKGDLLLYERAKGFLTDYREQAFRENLNSIDQAVKEG
jgi:(p)ppGpp synthase/HD superfamily hydrolase